MSGGVGGGWGGLGGVGGVGGVGGGAAPPICKTSNMTKTCRFLLSLARFCDNMSLPAQRY